MIETAPGKNRQEKLEWVWSNRKNTFQKLYNALTMIGKKGSTTAIDSIINSSKFNSEQYFIRFGDLPKSGVSHNHLINKSEKGISAYPVHWSKKHNMWELETADLSDIGMTTLDSFVAEYMIGKGRPIYLIQALYPTDTGMHDVEPLLNKNNLKVIKKIDPSEIWIDYYDGNDWWK